MIDLLKLKYLAVKYSNMYELFFQTFFQILGIRRLVYSSLKHVSAIFLSFHWMIKNYEQRFLFNRKSSFRSWDVQVFVFFSLSTFTRFKRTNESGTIYYVLNWPAWISRCNVWNNSKSTLYYIIKLDHVIHCCIKGISKTLFLTWKVTGHQY